DVALIQGEYASARAWYEGCLALCKEIDEKTIMASALLGMGLVGLVENSPEAGEHILHSLRLRVEMGGQVPQTSSLVGVAGQALHEGNPTQAARLLGAVEFAIKALNVVMGTVIKHLYVQTLAAVQEQLSVAAFQAAWEEGSQWSLEESVKLALEG
ncbi:MAG: hypothetical protein IH586_20805, partial [Anaerolineaceae bacterium]|nr:hypothetical protein [Anaerolineaceae bacterium]